MKLLTHSQSWTLPRWSLWMISGLILGLRPANERRRYKVTPSLTGWAQVENQPWDLIPRFILATPNPIERQISFLGDGTRL